VSRWDIRTRGEKLTHAQRAPGPQLQDYDLERKYEERVTAESKSGCKRIGGSECEDASYEDAVYDTAVDATPPPSPLSCPPAPAADSRVHRPRPIESVIAQRRRAALAAHSGRSRPKRKAMKPVWMHTTTRSCVSYQIE
jgi:hypothetical protein